MRLPVLAITLLALFFLPLNLIGQKDKAAISLNDDLQIIPLSQNIYLHKSWKTFFGFGRVASNGLIYTIGNEAIIMDTPINDTLSQLLVNWVEKELNLSIKGVIINHFHEDCLGGLATFHQKNIPSYSTKRCQKLAKKKGEIIPKIGFRKKLIINIAHQKVECYYFGKAHTSDNMVVYLPTEKALFGGCMIKSLKAKKGNLTDASVKKWSKTIEKIKKAFPLLETVVPGHGKAGNTALLDYTIELFRS